MIRLKLPQTRRSGRVNHEYNESSTADGRFADSIELHAIEGLEGTDGLLASKPSGGVFESPESEQKVVASVVEPSVVASVVPAFEDEQLYSYAEIIWTVISIVSYMVDVGSDIYVAVIYYVDEEWWWFGVTVVFIVVPSFTISTFSFLWYLEDKNLPVMSHPVRFIPRLVLVSLQLGPLIR
jgi:hypothetical protein